MTDDRATEQGTTDGQTGSGRYVAVGEAAKHFGITPDAIRARIRRGTLPAEKRGGVWYVRLPADDDDTTETGQTTERDNEQDATGAALVDLVAELTRKNAELSAAAAAWQARAGFLQERLEALESGPITTPAPDTQQDTLRSPESASPITDDVGHGQGQDSASGGTWGRLWRWLRGS